MDHIRIFVKYISSVLCSSIEFSHIMVDSFGYEHNDSNFNLLKIEEYNTK